MSSTERKIKISAEGNGVRSEFSRVRSEAKELARDMIRDAQQYSSDSKELIRNLNEQVSALERRNRLEREGNQLVAERKLASAKTEGQKDEAKAELRDISTADKENKQQIEVLKDIYLAILQTSREEIGKDKENIQENLSRLQGIIGTKDDTRDPMEVLKSSYQEQQLGGGSGAGIGPSRGGFLNNAVGLVKDDNMVRIGADFAKEQAGKQAARAAARGSANMAKAATLAGVIAALVSIVADPERDENIGNISRLTGAPSRNIGNKDGISRILGHEGAGNNALAGYDVTLDDAIQQNFMPVLREGGSKYLNQKGLRDAVSLDRGVGMEGATFAGFGRMQGGGGLIEIADQLFKAGRAAGTEDAFMEEYIDIQKQLAERQFAILGRIDTGINTRVVQQIAASDKAFADPRVLGGIIQSIDQSMRKSTTKEAEAFSMMQLQQLFPDKDPLELLKEKERGIAAGDGKLFERTIGKIKEMGGGPLNQVRSVQSVFGVESVTMAEKLLNKQISPSEAQRQINAQKGTDAESRALSADYGLNELKRSNAIVSESIKDFGKSIGEAITALKKFVDKIDNFSFSSLFTAPNGNILPGGFGGY